MRVEKISFSNRSVAKTKRTQENSAELTTSKGEFLTGSSFSHTGLCDMKLICDSCIAIG